MITSCIVLQHWNEFDVCSHVKLRLTKYLNIVHNLCAIKCITILQMYVHGYILGFLWGTCPGSLVGLGFGVGDWLLASSPNRWTIYLHTERYICSWVHLSYFFGIFSASIFFISMPYWYFSSRGPWINCLLSVHLWTEILITLGIPLWKLKWFC